MQKSYYCIECGFSTEGVDWLFTHFKAIHNLVRFPCGICKFETQNRYQFIRHDRKEHGDIYPCSRCKFLGTSSDDLENHVNKYHQNTFEKVFKRRTQGAQACPEPSCSVQHACVKDLKLHYRKVHEGIALFCKLCGQEFTRGSKLKSHIDHVHNETYNHKCGQCDFVSKYKSSVEGHIKTHTNNKDTHKHKCEECTFESKYKSSLRKHLEIHTMKANMKQRAEKIIRIQENFTKRKHSLEEPTMKRIDNENIKAHSKGNINDDGKRKLQVTKYPCLYCENDFACVSNLKDHIKSQHKDTLYFSEMSK